jgi:hypothetical protein
MLVAVWMDKKRQETTTYLVQPISFCRHKKSAQANLIEARDCTTLDDEKKKMLVGVTSTLTYL